MGLGKITVLDASPEMLTVAKEKLNKAIKDKTANIVEASFPGFPFQDKTFDAVMFNQVSNDHYIANNSDVFRSYFTYSILT